MHAVCRGIVASRHTTLSTPKQTRYHLKDVVLGKIYFLLVRIKIKHMELAIIRRESAGMGAWRLRSWVCVCWFDERRARACVCVFFFCVVRPSLTTLQLIHAPSTTPSPHRRERDERERDADQVRGHGRRARAG